ncbi:ubiquitin carboxyl-terminal hydrolase 35-like [Centruroides vittatus]|uniref:ubiquitin carboxyl-terminal hydrolase 35-like n=1 Tax=Centruroides vittatus TaxID=120091 RepID=UPI00350F95D3
MDKLFKGIVKSNNSQVLKQQLIECLLIRTCHQSIPPRDCFHLLKYAWETALYGETEFIRNCGLKVYESWSSNNKDALIELFNSINLNQYFEDVALHHKDMLLKLIKISLELQDLAIFSKLCIAVQNNCNNCLKGSSNIEILKSLIALFKTFPQCMPSGSMGDNLLESIIRYIAYLQVINDYSIIQFIIDIDAISAFLPSIWKNSETSINKTFNTISMLLSSNANCSPALASVIDVLPLHLVDHIKSVAGCWKSVEILRTAVTRMIHWLSWPTAKNIDRWILTVLVALAESKKYHTLIEIFNATIDIVFTKFQAAISKSSHFKILKFMLLSYQHSPAIFHKIAKQIPEILTQIEEKNKHFTDDIIEEMVELFHTVMYLHAGFPDLYNPIIEKLQKYKTPSKEKMKQLLSEYRWENQIKKRNKSETGMVGLDNIGNTCYLNCILQSLYMTDYFRYSVLKVAPKPQETILLKLQEVFAYLSLTQRPSFSPNHFLEISRPSWFKMGEQQDCAEFLHFLFDLLIEQNKFTCQSPQSSESQDNSLIENVFSGVSETTYICSCCNNSSVRSEKFTSLHLAIPDADENKDSSDAKDEVRIELSDLILNYLKPEILEGENKYFCDKCKELHTGKKQSKIKKFPTYLIITLLRFSYNPVLHKKTKIISIVNYPYELLWPLDENNCKVYHLYAVVIHSGTSTERGHYYTYARHLSSTTTNVPVQEQKWYLFNDSHVFLTSYNSLETLAQRFPKDTAYVLFYQEAPNERTYCITDENVNNFIHSELKELIFNDNIKYLEEQEAERSLERMKHSQDYLMLSKRFHRDFDGSPPSGGCGSSGSDMSFPRFVY